MATDVQLQKAVAYCINNGATVTESAKKFGVDRNKLSEMLSEMMNPQGGGAPQDVAEFSNSKVAHATIRVYGHSYEIVGVAIGSEKGASARIYDENGIEVNLNDFKQAYKISSFNVNPNTGEISFVKEKGAPNIEGEQVKNGKTFFDTLKNLWARGKDRINDGTVIVEKRRELANAGNVNGVVQGVADGVKGGDVQPDVKQALTQYGVDAKDYKNIEAGVKEQYDKMSDEKKAEVADAARKLNKAVEGGDADAIQKAVAEIASLFVPDDIPGIKVDETVFYACLAVSVVALVALAAEAGVGTALSAAVDKLVTSGIGKLAMATFAAVGLTSCSSEDTGTTIIDNSETKVSVAASVTTKIDNNALAEAYNKGIKDLMNFLKPYMEQLVNNQNTMMDFVAQILAKLDSQGVKLDNIEELIKNFMAQYGIDAKNKDELLAKIYTAITNADAATQEALNGISEKIDQNNEKADETNALLTKLIGLVNKLGKDGKELGSYILQMLNKIGLSMNANFSKLLEAIERGNVSLDEIKAMLAELNKLVADGNKQNQELGEKILNYLGAIGFEMNRNFTAVLEAINKGVAGTESLRDLLEKILDNQDKNTKAIIEAIGNIKIDGGNIDLSSIEKMLAELIDLTKKNGNTLSSIDGKLDVIQLTQQAILDKINVEAHKGDERYEKTNALLNEILDKVGKQNGSYDDSKLLDILNNLSKLIDTKLDQILDAIKDHDVKVTVDVTGQVKCECNCGNGGKHEGILGDLDKILE